MSNADFKKYTIQAKSGIKGEAFFETLIAEHCIPHSVVAPKDIGVDYFCEWVCGDRPTGMLFAVQVKTRLDQTCTPELVKKSHRLNGLDMYRIRNPHLKICDSTLHYWLGLAMPVYVFAVIGSQPAAGEGRLDCYYRRFSADLTKAKALEPDDFFEDFYKVNDGTRFLAFKDAVGRTGGFVRDLFIDHVRWCYHKGLLNYQDPASLGLNQFGPNCVFKDIIPSYRDNIVRAYQHVLPVLEHLGVIDGEDKEAQSPTIASTT